MSYCCVDEIYCRFTINRLPFENSAGETQVSCTVEDLAARGV